MMRSAKEAAERRVDDCFWLVIAIAGFATWATSELKMLRDPTYQLLAKHLLPAMKTDAKIEALRYIDGWIDNKKSMPLVAAAGAILDDMRTHVRAAIERLLCGGALEATTPLGDG
jgi:hypothetical protein